MNPCTCGQRYADPSVSCAPECMSNAPALPRDSADVDFSALAKACASSGPECRSAGGIAITEALKAKDAEIARLKAREQRHAALFGVPNGGQYTNDWESRAEVVKRKDAEIAALKEAVLYAERALEMGTIAARDAVTAKIAALRARGLLVPPHRPGPR